MSPPVYAGNGAQVTTGLNLGGMVQPGPSGAAMLSNPGTAAQGEPRAFPPDVEESANYYFQRIYTGQISIDEIVSLLKRFKNSKEQRCVPRLGRAQ